MSRAIEFFEAHRSPLPSRWREDAQWRRNNEYWLNYSRQITLKVLQAMEEQSVTQVELARRMDCTQQYVSNLLKGSSNMTLETIGRLERALNLDILRSALNVVSGYHLNEPADPGNTDTTGTSALVDGYFPGKRKKKEKK